MVIECILMLICVVQGQATPVNNILEYIQLPYFNLIISNTIGENNIGAPKMRNKSWYNQKLIFQFGLAIWKFSS